MELVTQRMAPEIFALVVETMMSAGFNVLSRIERSTIDDHPI